ncbi:MAG: adenylosuccinate synthetase [Anaerolineales bacterium]|nr:adenylosuccinate synthetase [Anaerolineales bacterium]
MTGLQPKVDLVVDLQFGSTGKGLICGYLGETGDYDTCITANMPNAGHTYIDRRGNKYMTKVLPASFVGGSIKTILIGPGAVFSLERLKEEMVWLRTDQTLRIHPNAMVLTPSHIKKEAKLDHIGSTKQGSAAAVIDKMMRSGKVSIAKEVFRDTDYSKFIASHSEWKVRLELSTGILAEGSQGYSLGINTQFYPFTTSRDCSPAAFLSNMGIPIPMLDQVIGTCRTLPIRVGGTSGHCYPDQEELSWDELDLTPEKTTVTNRVRRIFTYSKMQIEEACWHCAPDLVFLNFANYVEKHYVENIVAHIDEMSTVRWIGFGPAYKDIGLV